MAYTEPALTRLLRVLREPEQKADGPEQPRELGGRFRVSAKLASGGMSDLYVAMDLHTGREVALKIPHLLGDYLERRFALEADALTAVVAPSIVGYVARGTADESFLAMELVRGESLAARLERDGALPEAAALGVARRIAGALAAVHAGGWVHRDVKPSNIALTEEGGVRLVDFGLARPLDGPGAGTKSGDLVGTLSYMAPEQLAGHRVVDARTDVFALGCVLYECLTGKPAFVRRTREIAKGVWSLARHPPLDARAAGIGEDVAAVLDAMAAVDPAARLEDGLAVLERLLALEQGALLAAAEPARAAVRAAVAAALAGPVVVEGESVAAARATSVILAEILAPAGVLACTLASPDATATLADELWRAGHLAAARVVTGAEPGDAAGEPELVVAADVAGAGALVLERLGALAAAGLAHVVASGAPVAWAHPIPCDVTLAPVADASFAWLARTSASITSAATPAS